MAITTVARCQEIRPGLTAEQTAILQNRLDAAEAYVKAFLRYDPLTATSTGYVCSGSGARRLYLPLIPITAVSSVTVDGTAWVIYPTASYKMFIPPALPGRHWIEAVAPYVWTGHQNNIVITYTAGYSAASGEMEQIGEATAQLAVLLFDERTRLGIGAKTLGSESINQVLRNAKDYQFITETLETYRRRYGAA